MNTQTAMNHFVDAFNQMDITTMTAYLSDGLAFHGPAPQPLSKAQFIGMLHMLHAAFPDIKMNVVLEHCDGDQARITSAMQGTHTGTLDMTAFGGGPIPPTGKAFHLPAGAFDYGWTNGQIVVIQAQPNPGGGFEGIMQQLGLMGSQS
jgi:predicted ester cyclase